MFLEGSESISSNTFVALTPDSDFLQLNVMALLVNKIKCSFFGGSSFVSLSSFFERFFF
jgi:hypothetical protein